MKIDKKFILELNKPLAIVPRPFAAVARRLDLSEEEVLAALKTYKQKGWLRRFGAVLAHKNIGLKTNALVAWKIPAKSIQPAAKILAAYPAITHCYLRSTHRLWPYNLYSMVHADDRRTCRRFIRSIARKIKIKDFAILLTLREFKKTKSNLGGLFR